MLWHLNNPGFRRADYCNDNPGSKLPFEKRGRNQSTKYLFIFNAPGLLFPALKSSWQTLLEVINPTGQSQCLEGCSGPWSSTVNLCWNLWSERNSPELMGLVFFEWR